MNNFLSNAISLIDAAIIKSKAVHKHGGLCHTKREEGILIGYSDETKANVYGPESGKAVSFLELQNAFTSVHPNNQRETNMNYTLVIHHYVSRRKNAKLQGAQYAAGIYLSNYLSNQTQNFQGLNIFENVSFKSGILTETISPICEYSLITISISIINDKCNLGTFKLEDVCC